MRDILSRDKAARDLISGDNIEVKGELAVVLTVRHGRDTVTVGTTAGMLRLAPDQVMTELYKGQRY